MAGQLAVTDDVATTAQPSAVTEPGLAEKRGAAGRGRMLLALCFATFLVTGNGVAVSPFLLDMARDLRTDLAAVANLVALSSITWGISSLFAGAASDRIGRRPLLVGGLCVLVLSPLGVAAAQTYPAVAAWRMLGGIGGGAFMGTVFATVADRFPARERGRALGWLTTGQSLSLVIGVPLITSLGGIWGWRGAFWAYGIAMLVATLITALVAPKSGRDRMVAPPSFAATARLLQPKTIMLLLAGVSERLCYAAVSVFLPTYFVQTYGIPLGTLAIGLAIIASGNLVGNLIGGRLGDRFQARGVIVALSLSLTGLMALPLLLGHPGIWPSVALGFGYTLLNSIGRPVLLTALSEVSGAARGAVLGLNITGASFGWLIATAVGGPIIIGAGYGGLGLFATLVGGLGAALALTSWALSRRQATAAVTMA